MRNVFQDIDDMDFKETKLNFKPKEKKVNLMVYNRETIWDKLRKKPKTGGYYDTQDFKRKVLIEDLKEKNRVHAQKQEIRKLKRATNPHSDFVAHHQNTFRDILQDFGTLGGRYGAGRKKGGRLF